MDLLTLQYFMAAAEQKNFSKAARVTYTSQSNISKQIGQLEEELGCRLFERDAMGVVLTESGKFFFDGLKKLLPEYQALIENTEKLSDSNSKAVLKLGICPTMDLARIKPEFFMHVLSPNFEEFSVEMESDSIKEIQEKLSIGKVDCILYFSPLRIDVHDVERMPISRDYPMLYFSAAHPAAIKPEITIEDFRNDIFVRANGSSEIHEQYDQLPFKPRKIIETDSVTSAFLYIESNAAVGVFGPSQNRLGKQDIRTLTLPFFEKVGTDLVWLKKNNNPVLHQFLEEFNKFI